MKNAILIGTGALLLVFGISAPAFAQEQHDPQEQPAKPPDAKPTEKPQAAPPEGLLTTGRVLITRQNHPKKPNTNKTRRHPRKTRKGRPAHQATDGFRTTKMHPHFGRERTFRVGHPVIVEGRPRFSYGGYSFVIAQAPAVGLGI